ncbi:hypothetical protein N7478_006112 [Penicillium angulare]|uniref:uncharacterized protein n=1 Tax=Penicillium angulare TaxID=116970 RepID=UPI0025416F74|nr:uncharacterized protein N7478_006112 [Penicillium angulare]KAJ5280740.1 hypothetical protein N7478_006112 [Penicillium angulare]
MAPASSYNLTPLDRELLNMKDEDFVPHDWQDLQDIIARNDLAALKRKPSDLRRYFAWYVQTKAQYSSIMNFICLNRLKWPLPAELSGTVPAPDTHSSTDGSGSGSGSGSDSSPALEQSGPVLTFNNPTPFADPEDYKILRNDWPYGLAPGISHLVVWLRTPIAVKSGEGHLTDESRALINGFVQRKFVQRLAEDGAERFADPGSHVLWFKNWVGLQSVRALEHVHILLRDVPEEILTEWSEEPRPE